MQPLTALFEGIAKTNTTNTASIGFTPAALFEGIAKTNTTNTQSFGYMRFLEFEGIAKTNTTNTIIKYYFINYCLRVLLKQIQQTLIYKNMRILWV